MALEPIIATISVPVEPTAAFVGFTAQMGEWWDELLTPDAATFKSIDIDPEGDVTMVHDDGRWVWGRVTAWEPPEHFAMDFWLGHREDAPTVLDLTFTEEGDGTCVRLEHGGWEAATEGARAKYTHWHDLLRRFAAHVS